MLHPAAETPDDHPSWRSTSQLAYCLRFGTREREVSRGNRRRQLCHDYCAQNREAAVRSPGSESAAYVPFREPASPASGVSPSDFEAEAVLTI
jgi:hypothetical protein